MIWISTNNKSKKRSSYKKKDSLYKKPEVQGHKTLFSAEASGKEKSDGNKDSHDLSQIELNPEARADRFISLWIHENRPFRKYKGFRSLADTYGVEEVYFQIKVWYKHFVNNGDWTEEKYSFVIDKILNGNNALSRVSFTRYSFLYDHGREKSSDRPSGSTSSIYHEEEKQSSIEEVLDAWEKLERM